MENQGNFWRAFLEASSLMTDCKIVTKNGKQKFTHKIILASKSKFLTNILSDVPAGFETVVILPDHTLEEVEDLCEDYISEDIVDKELNEESQIKKEITNDDDDEIDDCDKKNIHDVSTGIIEWKHCDYKNIFSTELENNGSEAKDEKGTILFEKQKLYQSATAAYMR